MNLGSHRIIGRHSRPRRGSRLRSWPGLSLLALLLLLPLPAPAPAAPRGKKPAQAKGITHVVRPGQTLFRISQAYGVKLDLLLQANRLAPAAPLAVGQRLFIPGAKAVKRVEPYRPLSAGERTALEASLQEAPLPPRPTPAPPPRVRVRTDAPFVWPLEGPLNSPFGPRRGRLHAGIDIGSPHYQEVVAAADAEVLYAGETRGALGKAVILQHGRDVRTVYAHLSIIIAREGESVKQGQAIGGVGDTGRATGPHLHFEIRRHGQPVDPEGELPATIDELMRDLARPR